MSDEIKKKVFTPFFSTKFHKGTGLGLAITTKIVREHDGIVLLDTAPGKGCTFTIVLPNAQKTIDMSKGRMIAPGI